jgi:2-isopropylmalate synthase
VVRFVIEEILKNQRSRVRVDWHGHMDRGLGLSNSIAAVEAGADQVHGCALGIGERVGNTPMDLLLVNMKLLGYTGKNLKRLKDYCETVARACKVSLPTNYPVVGADAFRTGTGVHAVAVIKAMRKGDVELANLVYSGVPSHWFGMDQIIEVGPMSGRSNVIHWLERHSIEPLEGLVAAIFKAAKDSNRILPDAEIQAIVDAYPSKFSSGWAD